MVWTAGYGRQVVWFGAACALFAAICYGVASTVQAVAARATRDSGHGLDPRLLLRLLGQWRYLLSLVLDAVGLVGQITALRLVPLFLVQAAMATSIVITALVAVLWFDVRLAGIDWLAVLLSGGGLAVLGAAALSEGAGRAGRGFQIGLLITVLVLAALGVAAGRLPNAPRTALLGLTAGLNFGAMGIALRTLPSLAIPAVLLGPGLYTAVIAGVTAGWFYASALQRGGVVPATAMMLIAETVPPSVIGVVLLGDRTRPGWAPVAAIGFLIAVAGVLMLARFGDLRQAPATTVEPDVDHVGDR